MTAAPQHDLHRERKRENECSIPCVFLASRPDFLFWILFHSFRDLRDKIPNGRSLQVVAGNDLHTSASICYQVCNLVILGGHIMDFLGIITYSTECSDISPWIVRLMCSW